MNNDMELKKYKVISPAIETYDENAVGTGKFLEVGSIQEVPIGLGDGWVANGWAEVASDDTQADGGADAPADAATDEIAKGDNAESTKQAADEVKTGDTNESQQNTGVSEDASMQTNAQSQTTDETKVDSTMADSTNSGTNEPTAEEGHAVVNHTNGMKNYKFIKELKYIDTDKQMKVKHAVGSTAMAPSHMGESWVKNGFAVEMDMGQDEASKNSAHAAM